MQGYLAHKKHPPPGTLQKDFTQGPLAILGGVLSLMSKASLYPAPAIGPPPHGHVAFDL